MAGKKITVVISQSQGKNPMRRQLEEELAAALIMQPEVDVSLVPHLYDMSADHTGMLFLKSVPGDVVVLAWLYPRGARWTLDRQGVRGHEGLTLLKSEDEEEDDDEESGDETNEADEQRSIGRPNVPNRKIYCIDLRVSTDVSAYVDEIRRIAADKAVQTVDLMQWIGGKPDGQQLERYLHPEKMIAAARLNGSDSDEGSANGNGHPDLPEAARRRWYPVIDYSRCTNCMECIDFCLFGVYGVDTQDTILVEEQDELQKGLPGLQPRLPENAIIFPGHKTPAIAGANGEVAGLKIDLSKLFGAPDGLAAAVAERDAELVADGRDAVGMSVGIPKRQANKPPEKRDALDDLMDTLDKLDL